MQLNPAVLLSDYQPPRFAISTVDLTFDLYNDHVQVTSQLQLLRHHPGELYLFGDELELLSIELDHKPLSTSAYRREGDHLVIPQCPDQFTLTVVTRIRPQDNTKLSGLYRTNQLFCTQCEAEGFRRITFFPDRPDVLAIYTTRISADQSQYPILLSNGNMLDSGETSDGRHWVVWQDPFKKPSYLFALVAGDLACVADQFTTCSGRIIDLRLYVEPGHEDQCAHALASLKKAMRWDEEEYGREYDLDIFMIVAVSDFNMGAMENKGLNIFNAKYILARPDTATDQDYAGIEGVVAHEYFHNWTGNRITCRDWFQLSLKEGLTVFRDQEFSRDMNSRDVNRIKDVNELRNAQFPEDAGRMAHPVRPTSYQEINNFYTATIYNKGAEVIRMQQTLLGKEGFRRGMDLYFQRHDGQAVTIDDFVAAMEDANHVDFTQFKQWYNQPGTPVVEVSEHYHNGRLTLAFKQSVPPFHIPIRLALFNSNGEQLPQEHSVFEFRTTEQTLEFDGLAGKPIVSLLREFSAPVIIRREVSQDDLLALFHYETDGFAKCEAAQTLALTCITDSYHSPRLKWHFPQPLMDAYQTVLQAHDVDDAVTAEIIVPPGFEDVVALLSVADVSLVEEARDFYREQLGEGLYSTAHERYLALWHHENHSMDARVYGRRKLRNVCLWLMMKADEEKALPLCSYQYSKAKTMTDQIASLALLVNCSDVSIRHDALERFYQQWKENELVLDKWFALQASCELPGTLAQVERLLSHPAFNLKNPNKVRALIGAFCQSNPRHFHAADGSGYAFLAEMLLKLDPINPQIAARLATPFTRWQNWDLHRQALMKQRLEELAAHTLSRDLHEVVMRSLA